MVGSNEKSKLISSLAEDETFDKQKIKLPKEYRPGEQVSLKLKDNSILEGKLESIYLRDTPKIEINGKSYKESDFKEEVRIINGESGAYIFVR